MDISNTSFLEGLLDTLTFHKCAEGEVVGNPAFPSLDHQAKWRYARYPEMLQLASDSQAYGFKLPKDLPEEGEFPIELLNNLSLQDFGKDALQTGLAQVHRADPESLYFTLQEGLKNPTYTFTHQGGSWKGIPKKKIRKQIQELAQTVPTIDPAALMAGIKAGMLKQADIDWGNLATNTVGVPIQNAFNLGMRAISAPGRSASLSALTGLGLGAAYDLGRRAFYNTPEENKQESLRHRLLRYLLPAGALGGYGYMIGPVSGAEVDARFPMHSFKPIFK